MSGTYTPTEFLKLTPPQKQRLRERDPEQYDRLMDYVKRNFSAETDQEAAKALFNEDDD